MKLKKIFLRPVCYLSVEFWPASKKAWPPLVYTYIKKFWTKFEQYFSQFDLYAGHKIWTQILTQMCVNLLLKKWEQKYDVLQNLNFGHFLEEKSSLWLIRGSTNTRAYTVIKLFEDLASVTPSLYWHQKIT